MPKKAKKYSSAEKKAYYAGVGAALVYGKSADLNRATSNLTEKTKRSFLNGWYSGIEKGSWHFLDSKDKKILAGNKNRNNK